MQLALTVGLCSGFFRSMLFIICFLQELNPVCQLTDMLNLWHDEKEETYNVEEYIIGSGENKPRFILLISPVLSYWIYILSAYHTEKIAIRNVMSLSL